MIWSFTKRYMLRYLKWYLTGIFLIAITQFVSVNIIELIKDTVNTVSKPAAKEQSILYYVITIVVLACVVIVIRTASRQMFFTPGRMIEYDVRNDYFANLVSLQRDFFAKHDTGDLVSRCSNDIGYIRSVYGFGSLQIVNISTSLIFGFAGMVYMDSDVALYLACPMAIAFIMIQTNIYRVFKLWRVANEQLGSLSSISLNSYKGISVIQSYHAEPVFLQKFSEASNAYLHTNEQMMFARAFVMPIVQLTGGISIFLILWFIGDKVIHGKMNIGEIAAFIGYTSMVVPPLLSLGWLLNIINRSIPAMERLNEVILAKPNLLSVSEKLAAYDNSSAPTVLEARELSYIYPETNKKQQQKFQLQNINFTLTRGKILGIVGETGCGKTTLVETILRLNLLQEKQLFLQQCDAAHTDLDTYRSYFSAAPQSPFLFSRSLRENLCVALPNNHSLQNLDEHLLYYLTLAGFTLDPQQFPKGLDTVVGEKGVMLSGGQRQRVALARALLKNAAIYILDDVLSAVDHETEATIIQNLRRWQSEKAFIIVSHRISAIEWADEILVIDNGTIRDRGNHQQLLQSSQFYQKIYQHQCQEAVHEDNKQ